jgi:hypothetical protein
VDAGTEAVINLMPIALITLPFAWGNYYLAAKSGRSGWLFAALTIIPLVGIGITYYLLYSTIIYALNRLPPRAAEAQVFD